jgi:arginine decarboxylase
MKYHRSIGPLIFALKRYARKKTVRFHMPGHKGRVGKSAGDKYLLKNLYKWDVTELDGLDNFHEPRGVIKESQQLLARLYNSDKSFFLVNGSTSGVIAMICAAVKSGQKLLLSRASHKSALSALVISGASPVYVMPEIDEELGVYTQITPEKVKEQIDINPDAKAVFLTNPTYQGFCPDVAEISAVAKEHGMLVLVDEAHGPHLGFDPGLPPSAGKQGADGWVQSPHKILTSLTQSAWLHLKGSKLDSDRVSDFISLVTSTSPSYILMASLEQARLLMQRRGKRLVRKSYSMASYARDRINRDTPFRCVGREVCGKNGIYDIDLSRLMVNVSSSGYTGFEVERTLRQNFNIYAEYADFGNVYFLVGFANSPGEIRNLVKALAAFKPKSGFLPPFPLIPKQLPERALEPRQAFLSEGEQILLKTARGRIVKKALVPYPPGIPLVMPGEVLDSNHINLVREYKRAGGDIQGLGSDGCIFVVKE